MGNGASCQKVVGVNGREKLDSASSHGTLNKLRFRPNALNATMEFKWESA